MRLHWHFVLCLHTLLTAFSTAAPMPSSGRAVFCHYLIGGASISEVTQDVQQAQAVGFDAFALNVFSATDASSVSVIASLFAAAETAGFKLFFSFDMTHFTTPTEFIPLVQQYHNHPAYYTHQGLPFVSTFNGGALTFGYANSNAGWQALYKDKLNALGIKTFFVPVFDDSTVAPASFFADYPVVDGIFPWEDSWPTGPANVSSSASSAYSAAAKAASSKKSVMMGLSSLQYKHNEYGNWYRRGGVSLALRMPQILDLAPDFVEVQTWNDGGEGHYIGNVWPGSIAGTTIGQSIDGCSHDGWQVLIQAFTRAYKAGATGAADIVPAGNASVQGVFWHATLQGGAICKGDALGKPSGSEYLTDTIEVAVLVAKGQSGIKVNVWSGGLQIGSYSAVPGLNAFNVPGMRAGQVKVEVVNSAGKTLVGGTGPKSVLAESSYCNYNPQVVKLA